MTAAGARRSPSPPSGSYTNPPSRGGRAGAGQALVELALLAATLLTLMVGLVQLTLYLHAQGVVRGACQEGARVASAGPEDRLADGVAYAVDLVGAGLGRSASRVVVTGAADADTVTLEARGSLPLLLPGRGGWSLPLSARAVYQKERFRVAP